VFFVMVTKRAFLEILRYNTCGNEPPPGSKESGDNPEEGTVQISRVGSSKDVFYSDVKGMEFNFSDRVSVFDRGPIPVTFTGLGAVRCSIAAILFEKLDAADFRTHFRERLDEQRIAVTPFNIPELDVYYPQAFGRLLPLEFLFRFVATKKFCSRVEGGAVDRAAIECLLSLDEDLVPGMRFQHPFVECSTKHQAADTYVSDEEAARLAGLTLGQLQDIYKVVARAAIYLKTLFRSVGFDLCDGKIEGALTEEGMFVIADSISPDELRLTDSGGRSYDKDPVRRWYEECCADWVKELGEAKAKAPYDKSGWPPYSAEPPPEVIQDLLWRYEAVRDALSIKK